MSKSYSVTLSCEAVIGARKVVHSILKPLVVRVRANSIAEAASNAVADARSLGWKRVCSLSVNA